MTQTLTPFNPAQWGQREYTPMWEIQGLDKNNKPIGSPVFVKAACIKTAINAGKYWRKIVGYPKCKKSDR